MNKSELNSNVTWVFWAFHSYILSTYSHYTTVLYFPSQSPALVGTLFLWFIFDTVHKWVPLYSAPGISFSLYNTFIYRFLAFRLRSSVVKYLHLCIPAQNKQAKYIKMWATILPTLKLYLNFYSICASQYFWSIYNE